jgi:acyl-CoA hydrolase
MQRPERLADADACVQAILARCGKSLRVATPLGLGKPNVLLNALYAAARRDTGITLDIYTALSLARPVPKPGLEARFLGPFLERHFGADYPDLDYVADQLAGRLPPNVRIHEFYLQSGALLDCAQAQRDYASENYTHVARDLVPLGINLIVQLVALRGEGGATRISLSCNPDVTLDLLDRLDVAQLPRPLLVAVAHPDLPFLGHGAELPVDAVDMLLDSPPHRLFALPREPVDDVEYAIGYHASALVKDGGTLQIGIGALSDALVYALMERHADNASYVATLAALDDDGNTRALAERIGGTVPLTRGLYGASEMVMDGFMALRRAGVLTRLAYDDEAIERAVAKGVFDAALGDDAGEHLYAAGVLPARIDARECAWLQRFGLLPEGARVEGGALHLTDGRAFDADLTVSAARAALGRVLAGRHLRDGRYLRGAFYLGSNDLYDWLRGLEGEDYAGLDMTRVSDVNQLYGGREALDALQRRGARFFNTCMMATLLGAAVSDQLDDGRVVSGVGGQYNFVAMAHALDDGRSVLMLHATHGSRGRVTSNIRWNYGHTTIPRHLRDIVVTEYGVADLRGKSDQECIKAMLAVSDARFLDGLVAAARRSGKLAADFRVPDAWRAHRPETLARALAPARASGRLPAFPLGCDFDAAERRLLPALAWLRERTATRGGAMATMARALLRLDDSSSDEAAALVRMRLADVNGLAERLQRRLLRLALSRTRNRP